jgi:hypothetical protein
MRIGKLGGSALRETGFGEENRCAPPTGGPIICIFPFDLA